MKTLKSITYLLLVLLVTACSNNDDLPQAISQTDSFRIKATILSATFPVETEGDALEVYGTISTKLILNNDSEEEITLWQRDREDFEALAYNDEYVINSVEAEHTFVVQETSLNNNSRLEIYTLMNENDPDGNDDFLGENTSTYNIETIKQIPNEDNPISVQISLDEFNGVSLLVKLTIEHIRG